MNDSTRQAKVQPSVTNTKKMPRVLVCGATGYVGGRLVPRLLGEGYRVRCFARSPEKLAVYPWRDSPDLEVVQGNLENSADIQRAAEGVDVAYYLVHSMVAAGDAYAERDRTLARTFATAARQAGLQRVIYLGGLGELGEGLSKHLASRREVEHVLREHGVPTTVLRAAMIIGSGSASFEILRYLVDRLPVMIVPKWVDTKTQPIAIRDVLRYLVGCLRVETTIDQTIDIGGKDVLTYGQMMHLMAEKIGLKRRVILPVPVLTPRLSSRWIGLVTPVTSKIARPLAEGLRNRTVCRDNKAIQLMPGPLFNVDDAVDAALGKLKSGQIETRWSTAGEMPGDPTWSGGTVFCDAREVTVGASAEDTYLAVCKIGGDHGYWGSDWLWTIRGVMDKCVGGPGLRRGRRHPQKVGFGEAIDFWRVSSIRPNELLQLHAEMRLPGDAELQFRIEKTGNANQCRLTQMARFRPRGLLGIVYWYAVLPCHVFVFPTMLRGIQRDAESAVSNRPEQRAG